MQNYWFLIDELRKIPAKYFWGVYKQFLDRIIAESHPEIELLRPKFMEYEMVIKEKEKSALGVLLPIFEDIERTMKEAKREDDQLVSARQLISGEYRSSEPLSRSVYHGIRYVVEGNLDLFSEKYANILTKENGGITYIDYNKFRELYPAYFEFDHYLDDFREESEYLPEYALYRLESDREAFSILSEDEIDSYARPIILKDLIILVNYIEFPTNESKKDKDNDNEESRVAKQSIHADTDINTDVEIIRFEDMRLDMKRGFLFIGEDKIPVNSGTQVIKFIALLLKDAPSVVSYGKIRVETGYGTGISDESLGDLDQGDLHNLKKNLRSHLLKKGQSIPNIKEKVEVLLNRIQAEKPNGYRFSETPLKLT